MEQVIVIALPVFPPLENALDIFTQRYTNGAIGFYATGGVAAEKVHYASSIASALLAMIAEEMDASPDTSLRLTR